MAKIYKMSCYLVDPNDCYENPEEWFTIVIERSDLYCPIPIKYEVAQFDWDDNLDINCVGCSEGDCEKYFEEE